MGNDSTNHTKLIHSILNNLEDTAYGQKREMMHELYNTDIYCPSITPMKIPSCKSGVLSIMKTFPLDMNLGKTLYFNELEIRKYEAFDSDVKIPESITVGSIALYLSESKQCSVMELYSTMDPYQKYKLAIVFKDNMFIEPLKIFLFQKLYSYMGGSPLYQDIHSVFGNDSINLRADPRHIYVKCNKDTIKPHEVTKYIYYDKSNTSSETLSGRWDDTSRVEYLNYKHELYKDDTCILLEILHIEDITILHKHMHTSRQYTKLDSWLGVNLNIRSIYGI